MTLTANSTLICGLSRTSPVIRRTRRSFVTSQVAVTLRMISNWYPNLPDKLRHHWWPPGHVCPSEPWLCGDHSLSCCANVTCEAVITQQVRHPVRRNLPAGVVVPPCSLDYKSDPLELCYSCHNPGLVKHNEAVIEARTAATCVCGELCRWRKQRGKAKPLK